MQYVVKSGDSLSKIALNIYGDMSRWGEILRANPQITDPNKIYVGQTLTIPSAQSSGGSSSNLPAVVEQSSQDDSSDEEGGMDWMKIALIGGAAVLGYFVIKMVADKKAQA